MSNLNVYYRTVTITTNKGKFDLGLTQAGLYKIELERFTWRSPFMPAQRQPLPTIEIPQLPMNNIGDITLPVQNYYQEIKYEYSRYIYLQGILDYNIYTIGNDNTSLIDYEFQDEVYDYGSGSVNVQQSLTLIFKLTKID